MSSINKSAAPFVFTGFTGDRSGSMIAIYKESATGLYEWATDLIESANENNQQGRMFITCFDTRADRRLDNVDFKNVNITQSDSLKWMEPRGSTRLYDTAIEDLDNIVSKAKEFKENLPRAIKMLNPEISIVWACCTDGYDNISLKTAEDLKNKVLWAREQGVKCFFLAANQDAVTTGKRYGFSEDTSLTYTADSSHSTMAFRSVSTNMRQASCGQEYSFTQNQRQSSQETTEQATQLTPQLTQLTQPQAPQQAPQLARQFTSPPVLTNRQRFYMNQVPTLTRSHAVRFW